MTLHLILHAVRVMLKDGHLFVTITRDGAPSIRLMPGLEQSLLGSTREEGLEENWSCWTTRCFDATDALATDWRILS